LLVVSGRSFFNHTNMASTSASTGLTVSVARWRAGLAGYSFFLLALAAISAAMAALASW
jgi:hypothetical protein